MKKSEMYHAAQLAVLGTTRLDPEEKLETLRELMVKEELAKFTEKEEKEDA